MNEKYTLSDSQRATLIERLPELGLDIFGLLANSGNILPLLENRGDDYPRIAGVCCSVAKIRANELILEDTKIEYFKEFHQGLIRLYRDVSGTPNVS